MKRTDIERRERELRRKKKKLDNAERRTRSDTSVGAYINALYELLIFNEEKIYNTTTDEEVLTVLEAIQEDFPDKTDVILRKAIRKTKVAQKQLAFDELSTLLN